MTKVKITGLENELKRTKLRIARAIAKSKFNETVQKDVVDEIRTSGVKPSLKSSTIKQRKRLASYNDTHPNYAPTRSNLTFTGELLNSLLVKFVAGKLAFVFTAKKKKHKKLKTKKGRATKGRGISNKDLLEIQNESRPILQVFERAYFRQDLEKKLKTAITRFFK